jgi:uncharacterized protein YggE
MSVLKVLGTVAFAIIFTLVSLFVYTKLAGPLPFSITSTVTQKTDSFSVTGEGKSSIVATSATVRLGVTADGATADAAKNKMNQVINKVTSEIKALGIQDKDIKTENISVYEDYNNRPVMAEKIGATPPVADPNSTATSYRANTTLVINANQIDLANKIIDVGTKNGANQLGGVQFNNDDKTAAENEARQKAIEAAKSKAQTAASAAGFNLGKIINYSESTGGGGPMIYAAKAGDSATQNSTTQLNPGENELVISVTLSYEVN